MQSHEVMRSAHRSRRLESLSKKSRRLRRARMVWQKPANASAGFSHPVMPVAHLAGDMRALTSRLKLLAYAADAMRVLSRMECHAQQEPAFEQLLRSICPDWHNPGAAADPADLITDVLSQMASDLERCASQVDEL